MEKKVGGTDWKSEVRRRVRRWFQRRARDLPWRRTRDPYAIWVSEIMLQQTQVATVVEYFESFLQKFPTVEALAAAPETEVLRAWEGLGYYRRARRLHQAAKMVCDQFEGQLPRDIESLQALPGIGRYTAGAILSIAWDERQPILEANTIRLFARLLALREDPRRTSTQKQLWQFASDLLPRHNTGQFNQGLMELGSRICTPTQPHCEACPLASLCPTHAGGWEREIPLPAVKKDYESIREILVVIWNRKRTLAAPCPSNGRWAGLWDFPRFRASADSPNSRSLDATTRTLEQLTGVRVGPLIPLGTFRHSVTRYRIHLTAYETHALGPCRSIDGWKWISSKEMERIPLSVTGRKVWQSLAKRDGPPTSPRRRG